MAKYIVSTVAFSLPILPGRLSPDIQMILWAGALRSEHGLNTVCKPSLSRVPGVARAIEPPRATRPVIGMTWFGSSRLSCLSCMTRLRGAGASGTPQIVAPGRAHLIDWAGWQDIPAAHADRPFRAHNRLTKSAALGIAARRALVRNVGAR